MLDKLLVRDCMTKSILSFAGADDIVTASKTLVDSGTTGAPVLDDRGNLIGILSDTDCIRALTKYGFDPDWRGTVSDFMSAKVETVDIGDSILTIADKFVQNRFRLYPVLDDNRLVGQVTRKDVLKAMYNIERKA